METDGNRVHISDVEYSPGHAGKLENLLRGLLKQVQDPVGAGPGCDASCFVGARDRAAVLHDGLRTVLFVDDLVQSGGRSICGRAGVRCF